MTERLHYYINRQENENEMTMLKKREKTVEMETKERHHGTC